MTTANYRSRIRCGNRFCAVSNAKRGASAEHRNVPRRARWRAQQSRPSPATGVSACSCRPSPSSRTISTSWAAVEDTAAELELPIHLEGYEPPRDPRLNLIKVTPDPGVIEVNVQPASSWDEMRTITEGLYDDAHHSRLGDREIHARRPAHGHRRRQSRGARRRTRPPTARSCVGADLLRSLVTYWQHHPSLPIFSRGLSSGRRARRRASTKRGTIRCTSSSSRSSKRTRRNNPCHRGSSTGCSAICLST